VGVLRTQVGGSQKKVFDAEGMGRVRRDYSLLKEVVFGFK
jgi:hypothetical protein